MRLLPLVLLLTLHGHAAADPSLDDYAEEETLDPVAKITGPETGRPGQIVMLDASGSELAEGFAWHVETTAKAPDDTLPPEGQRWADALKANGWQEPEGEKEPLWLVSTDGHKVLLASYPGTYQVTLAVGNTVTAVPSLAHHTFVSSSPADAPPPPDDSPPDFDLSDESARWAAEVTKHRDRLGDLGDAFIQVGSAHATLGSKQAIDGLLKVQLQGGFAAELSDWSGLAVKVDTALAEIRDAATVEQYGAAVESIGRGIKR